ncbi:flavodoxin domain-containing protein, partial [Porphyromonas loveana]
SRYEAEEGAVVLYGTMYGNTEVLADTIAQGIAAGGVRKVVCHNVAYSPASNILRDIFKYKAVVIGSPTYSNEIFSPIRNIMEMIRLREVKNRYLSVFGSFSWAGQAVKKIVPFAEEMGWELIGDALEQKMSITDDMYEKGWQLGLAIAERLKADRS